jgi:hypothetical protein
MDEPKDRGFTPGVYQHYKGGMYTAVGLVTHHETRQPMVLYFSHHNGTYNVRPLNGWEGDADGWNDHVEKSNGDTVRRFLWIRDSC